MPTATLHSVPFRHLARRTGGTEAALRLLQGLKAREQSLSAEGLAKNHGLDVTVVKQLADLSGISAWVGEVRAEGQVRAQIAAGPAPRPAAHAGATLARHGHVHLTAGEFISQHGLDHGLPTASGVARALNAKYPLSGRWADEFPEGVVFAEVNIALSHQQLAGFAADAGTGEPFSATTLVGHLVHLAARQPDLAREVLCDGEVRGALAAAVSGPLSPGLADQVAALAELPRTCTAAELAESGTQRLSRQIDSGLRSVFPDDTRRAALVAALVPLRHPEADQLVFTPAVEGRVATVGFASDGLACGMRLDLDARVVPDERPGVFEVDIDPRATRVDLAPVGMSALAALTAANIMALGLPVGQRTAAQVGRALASQGPFSVPANGVAVIASADRDRLRFTLIDVNDQPLGNGVTVLGNVMLSANARRPEPVVPNAADRFGRGRGFSGFALFS